MDIFDLSSYIKELSKDDCIKNVRETIYNSNKKIRLAYPNTDDYMAIPGTHDTQKWLEVIKTIYINERNGIPRKQILKKVTSDWSVTEVYDFLNWLKFYEEGAHLKYKVAQYFYGNADVGYLLPIKKDPSPKEETGSSVSGRDIDFARDDAAEQMPVSEKKRIIERQRQKIFGRLDSAEKLLRSPEGQIFAENEMASLLDAIYDLKKKIQMLNKRSISSKSYDDLIIRQANSLTKKGFCKAADMLYSLADGALVPASPAIPTEVSGTVGGLPMTGPGAAQPPSKNNTPLDFETPKEIEDDEPMPKGLVDFLQGLKTSKLTVDNNVSEDSLEVDDCEEELVVEAQVEPIKPLETAKSLDTAKKPVEINPIGLTPKIPAATPIVQDNKITKEPATETSSKDFDKMINAIFSNLTISDVIAKYEEIANYYKTREMPRQLALGDMLLSALNLASFFPDSSEANNKALEANNYILTRVENILSKLRGTLQTKDIGEVKEKNKVSPEVEMAMQKLQEQEDKDKARKQMRKDIEDKSLQEQVKESPEIDMEEELKETPPASPEVKPEVKPEIKPEIKPVAKPVI